MESGQQFMFPSLLQGCGDLFQSDDRRSLDLMDPAEVYRFIAEVDYVRESWQGWLQSLKYQADVPFVATGTTFLLSSTNLKI